MENRIDISNKNAIPLIVTWFLFIFCMCVATYFLDENFGFYATLPTFILIFGGTPIYFMVILPKIIPLNAKDKE